MGNADGLLVANGRAGLNCFFEDGNRSSGVDFDQVQSEDGKGHRETRRGGELTRFVDALWHRGASGTFAGGGDRTRGDGDESPDRLVRVAGGACQLDPTTRALDDNERVSRALTVFGVLCMLFGLAFIPVAAMSMGGGASLAVPLAVLVAGALFVVSGELLRPKPNRTSRT